MENLCQLKVEEVKYSKKMDGKSADPFNTDYANPNLNPNSGISTISNGSLVDSVFWSLPTQIEVQNAISSFQSFMQGISSLRPAEDLFKGVLRDVDPIIVQYPGFKMVFAAFRLLQTVQSVQTIVTSISSDGAVWNSVLKNNEVQKFQHSLKQGKVGKPFQGSKQVEPNIVLMILNWILDAKHKVLELIEVLKSLVTNSSNLFSNLNSQLREIVCSSVLLSIITLMIVLVNRAYDL